MPRPKNAAAGRRIQGTLGSLAGLGRAQRLPRGRTKSRSKSAAADRRIQGTLGSLAGCRGSAPARAQIIHRCKTTPEETRGCRGPAPCPCPNPRNPAWNRDRVFAETDARESSGTEANSRASLSRRLGVKPTSPRERQPQRDSFQACAPLCRNPKTHVSWMTLRLLEISFSSSHAN